MATSSVSQAALRMFQSRSKHPYIRSKSESQSACDESLSDSTEILDTDFDSDFYENYSVGSARRSSGSLADSVTTASTPDDIKTPVSTGLTGFHFHIDENPVAGPTGPHLFRLMTEPPSIKEQSVEVELIMEDAPLSATIPLYGFASKLEPERRDTPVPDDSKKQSKSDPTPEPIIANNRASGSSDYGVAKWSPQDVVKWMQTLGFEDGIVEKFFINDISGSILLELQVEDLKELDIQSFGKRHQLMGAIRQLRNGPQMVCDDQAAPEPVCREDTATPKTTAADVGTDCSTSPITDEEKPGSRNRQHKHRRRQKHKQAGDIGPDDSVSIVAIEQLLPRLHTCSKGENCRKWQKQQVKLARLVEGLPAGALGGSVIVAGDPGNAATAQALAKTPKSDVTPSLIASSDVLGPEKGPEFQLSKEKLGGVQPRDPQENVRNFLNFQRLSRLQPVNDPATPPQETLPSPESDSPGRANASLAENLRHLPKLRIPSAHNSLTSSTLSPSYSAQRTITPSILHRKQPFAQPDAPTPSNPYSAGASPADFYRQHPQYSQSTPLSEMDVPVTAILLGPVSRNISQSVPPDMRFGNYKHHVADPVRRPASTKAENHRRLPSHQNSSALCPLDEVESLGPIETPEDLDRTPRAAHCKNNPFSPGSPFVNDIMHSGWMKKRKTTRLLRHDWEDHHFTLRGTKLVMHPDEEASHRDSKALEYIDVDDYAVACSSLPSSSKLTAAFKKTVLKRKDNVQGEAAFAFSLIPSPNGVVDRKFFLNQGSKAHHFAVKTREERIGWMRELMLAKALRRGRESGATVNLNGTAL
ncbi:SAM and PH domain protein [Aspergillus clavatus NRRL 1]|uniref:SAM and PH domain protein n=1 Tax=Aspergillus clavatus (strain ATCC 1007 / CBS 513.65 / DSM 816 / NCTC 3887 / NRRL 1 / QM 1276 / 107) TaxID=344612 RepID=A1CE91_ASPCL|nr:SAM and PH domain protein [Aspergillus clavatus NRRL 1]EAW11190.1 SAM and PH domain protein [Aspergillus clavatus NRRL 1]